jgi:hypothetical protein
MHRSGPGAASVVADRVDGDVHLPRFRHAQERPDEANHNRDHAPAQTEPSAGLSTATAPNHCGGSMVTVLVRLSATLAGSKARWAICLY